MPDHQALYDAAKSFCDTVKDPTLKGDTKTEALLSHFAPDCLALEHGHTTLARFLGKEYRGPQGVKAYFDTLAGLLSYTDMHFPEYTVDVDHRRVWVLGSAMFTWNKTIQPVTLGNAWRETLVYRLEFDDQCKIKRYEVWADTGAAHLASRGQLPPENLTSSSSNGVKKTPSSS